MNATTHNLINAGLAALIIATMTAYAAHGAGLAEQGLDDPHVIGDRMTKPPKPRCALLKAENGNWFYWNRGDCGPAQVHDQDRERPTPAPEPQDPPNPADGCPGGVD